MLGIINGPLEKNLRPVCENLRLADSALTEARERPHARVIAIHRGYLKKKGEVGFDSQSTGRGTEQAKWDISMSPQHVSYQACSWSVSTRSTQYTQLRSRNVSTSDGESLSALF